MDHYNSHIYNNVRKNRKKEIKTGVSPRIQYVTYIISIQMESSESISLIISPQH